MTETLRQRLIRHEGIKLRPYPDTQGRLTIGVGRCLTSNGISYEEAYHLLDNDIENVQESVVQAFPWAVNLDPIRLSVIQEMVFQLGVAGVQAFPKMIQALKNRQYAIAASEMLNSVWHGQTPSRCEELANIMLNGDNPLE